MMSNPPSLVELKTRRSGAKQQMTVAANRLTRAVQCDTDHRCVDEFMVDLERCYSDFNLCDEQFDQYCDNEEINNEKNYCERYGSDTVQG